jgi:hypothetical protein
MKVMKPGFPAFLKILSLPEKRWPAALKNYLREGGYNFYWSMQKGIRNVATYQETEEVARNVILGLKSEHERKHNLYGFEVFCEIRPKFRIDSFVPEMVKYETEDANLSIKIDPEFGYWRGSQKVITSFWNPAFPKLDSHSAGLGILLKQWAYDRTRLSDAEFHVYDLRSRKVYGHKDVPAFAEAVLNRKLKAIEDLWLELNEKPKDGNSRSVQPGDRL